MITGSKAGEFNWYIRSPGMLIYDFDLKDMICKSWAAFVHGKYSLSIELIFNWSNILICGVQQKKTPDTYDLFPPTLKYLFNILVCLWQMNNTLLVKDHLPCWVQEYNNDQARL